MVESSVIADEQLQNGNLLQKVASSAMAKVQPMYMYYFSAVNGVMHIEAVQGIEVYDDVYNM